MNQVTEKELMGAILRKVERETGRCDSTDYWFNEWRRDVKEDLEIEPQVGDIAVAYAEKAVKVKEELEYIDRLERIVRVENPVGKLAEYLTDNCTPVTKKNYLAFANRYMKFTNYMPEFTAEEIRAFLVSNSDVEIRTRKQYRSILETWFYSMEITFPILKPRHKHSSTTSKPKISTLTFSQVEEIITRVKKYGSPEMKYYIALATYYYPRRIELGEITGDNFNWGNNNGNGTGTLSFQPHKNGLPRVHKVPAELVPYLKEYSAEVEFKAYWVMTSKFHWIMKKIGVTLPQVKPGYKGYGWHAFRHTGTSAFLEKGISETMLSRWTGWRSGAKEAPMVGRYYDPVQLDTIIQSKHPFIGVWAREVKPVERMPHKPHMPHKPKHYTKVLMKPNTIPATIPDINSIHSI